MEPTAESNTAQNTADNDMRSLASWLQELPPDLKKGIALLGDMAADFPEVLRDRPLYAAEAIIAETDRKVNALLNAVIHHPDFTELESAWRGLHYLVTRTPPAESIKIRVYNISKKQLSRTIRKYRGTSWDQSPIFRRLYEDEYGTAGGEPLGVIIGDYYFNHLAPDMELLKGIAQIAAATHSPFISAADPSIMNLDSWRQLSNPRDITSVFSTPEYTLWQSFRESEDSRYVALTLPRILARVPYGPDSCQVSGLSFTEEKETPDRDTHVWINAAYAMGININRAFDRYGWCARIRGVRSGGIVDLLPAFLGHPGKLRTDMKIPLEIAIPEHREEEISSNGFLPLCYCKNTSYAVFPGGQTVNKPHVYDNPAATANAQLSARLPYMFAVCRFAHYLKCIVRDKLGSFKSREEMSKWLSDWSSEYVTSDPNADEEVKARYPLAEARVVIEEREDRIGYYDVKFYLRPHYQLEGLTTTLCLSTRVPSVTS